MLVASATGVSCIGIDRRSTSPRLAVRVAREERRLHDRRVDAGSCSPTITFTGNGMPWTVALKSVLDHAVR